jgi:hypothetical protein
MERITSEQRATILQLYRKMNVYYNTLQDDDVLESRIKKDKRVDISAMPKHLYPTKIARMREWIEKNIPGFGE